MLTTGDAAGALIEAVRARPWGLAVAVLADGEVEFGFDEGNDPLTERSLFEVGSMTKTMTGVLLADAVVRGETSLDARLSDVLGADAGGCARTTLLELATQRSGLPRLPPNLDLSAVDMSDPYRDYGEPELVRALAELHPSPGGFEYSNLGFMVLGLALSRLAGKPYGELIEERLFTPLRMSGARCPSPLPGDPAVPGYSGAQEVPRWSKPLPGPGGVNASIADIASYLGAHLDPASTPLGPAIELATQIHAEAPNPMGLGWMHLGGGWQHNGGTGGFRCYMAFFRPTKTAVALLANSGGADAVDAAGQRILTAMLRSRSA
jgi:CubicO group peptidase (beta-lactamase class C family)